MKHSAPKTDPAHRDDPDTLLADRLRAAGLSLPSCAAASPPPDPKGRACQPAPVCVEEAWRRAREDYERGVSAPVCAERHGLRPRTVRHRAAEECWRRPPRPSTFRAGWGAGPPPAFAGEPATADDLADEIPELSMFTDAAAFEVGELLLHPDPARMSRFAFRRAAEAAARGAAAEAAGWMRLVSHLQRLRGPLERDLGPISAADALRADYAANLRRAYAAEDWPRPEPSE